MPVKSGRENNASVVNDYIAYIKSRNYARNTMINYVVALEQYWEYLSDNQLDILQVAPADLDQYVRYLYGLKDYSDSTISAKLSVLNSFYEYCLMKRYIALNPVIRTLYPRVEQTPISAMSQSDYKLLLPMARTDRVKSAIIIMYNAGLRISELNGLMPEQVHLYDRPHIELYRTKNRKPRICPLLATDDEQKFLQRVKTDTSIGSMYNDMRGAVYYLFKRYNKKYGTNYSSHSLRKGYATTLARRGVRIELIAHALGHKHINTSLRYIHITEYDLLGLVS